MYNLAKQDRLSLGGFYTGRPSGRHNHKIK